MRTNLEKQFPSNAAGHRKFCAMAIAASGAAGPFPCGACRQVMAEFCPPDLPVYVAKTEGYTATTLGELLPNSFTSPGETRP